MGNNFEIRRRDRPRAYYSQEEENAVQIYIYQKRVQGSLRPAKQHVRIQPNLSINTRTVIEDFFSSRPNLTDGCTPILVMDTADIIGSLQRASLKNNIKPLNEEPYEEVSN